MWNIRGTTLFLCLSFLPTLCVQASPPTEIIYCKGADGETTYTDRPCPGGKQHQIDPQPAVSLPPLRADELQKLQALSSAAAARRQAQRRRQQQQRQHHTRQQAQQAACRELEDKLRALAAQRRAGYKLSESRALQQRERALKQARKQTC